MFPILYNTVFINYMRIFYSLLALDLLRIMRINNSIHLTKDLHAPIAVPVPTVMYKCVRISHMNTYIYIYTQALCTACKMNRIENNL